MKIEHFAVLGVDIQNDFCPGGALAVKDGDRIVKPMNRVIQAVLGMGGSSFLSRDWHPIDSKHFQKWPVHCVQNTPRAAFHPQLDLRGSRLISKGMGTDEDAYSAFDGQSEAGENLRNLLSACKVLVVGGLATDYCVKSSVLDASKIPNLQVIVLLDAIRAVNLSPYDGIHALSLMENAGAKMTTSSKFIRLLS